MSWSDWAAGVLDQIGAPANPTTIDALWAWSNAESGADVMRWNNPLNTTLNCCGGVNMNSVGVKSYPTVGDGVTATVSTLLNGRYPLIVSHLQNSVPRSQWGDACAQLGTWGTGCGWLNTTYGAAPGVIGEDVTASEARGWVILAYRSSFDRNPSLDEISLWQQRVNLDGSNVDLILAQILNSPEAVAHAANIAKAIADVEAPAPTPPADDDSLYALKTHVHTVASSDTGPAK